MIRFERTRFTYGYKWNLARMRASTVLLPAIDELTPDWDAMDSFMQTVSGEAAQSLTESEAD